MFAPQVISQEVLWGISLALLSMVTYGICMVAVSVVLKGMSSGPGSMVAAAAGVPTGLLLAAIQLAVRGASDMPSIWAVTAFALAGICSTYLGRWLVFKSIETVGPSTASGLQCTSPMMTAVVGWVFLGEAIGAIGFLGMGLGILGLAGMSIGIGRAHRQMPTSSAVVAGARPATWQGGFLFSAVLLGLASAAAYSGSHVFRASAVRHWNEALLGTTIGAVAGLLTLALASRKKLPGYMENIRANPKSTRIYLAIGALQFSAQALVIESMRYIPASLAALISMSTPLAVIPISYFFLRKREKLSPAIVLGICLTLAGMALVVVYGPGRSRP
jgi:drug/metabolite transporter (DMT)-like permease